TLPKIQEQTPRSRVFERPAEKTKDNDPAPIKTEASRPTATSTDTSANKVSSITTARAAGAATATAVTTKPLLRPRYGQGGVGGAVGNAAFGVSGAAAKAVNPKLQAYIQKYNLAANTRS
ncbi:hypothetical protein BGZ65_010613, partial [Modicella reniformis]